MKRSKPLWRPSCVTPEPVSREMAKFSFCRPTMRYVFAPKSGAKRPFDALRPGECGSGCKAIEDGRCGEEDGHNELAQHGPQKKRAQACVEFHASIANDKRF